MMRWLPVALVGVGIALVNFTLINLISATMAYRFETAMAYLEERGKLLRGLGVLLGALEDDFIVDLQQHLEA